jgi:hypothetical protein
MLTSSLNAMLHQPSTHHETSKHDSPNEKDKRAMLHLPSAHHETRKHDSPNEIKIK